MYSQKVKFRFLFIVVFLILIALTTFTVLKVLKDNVVYFKSPSDINLLKEISSKKIRVGGMVKKDSLIIKNEEILINKSIRKHTSYNNINDKFELSQFEANVINNITEEIIASVKG